MKSTRQLIIAAIVIIVVLVYLSCTGKAGMRGVLSLSVAVSVLFKHIKWQSELVNSYREFDIVDTNVKQAYSCDNL